MPITTLSMLLKSWAMPPVSRPTASSLLACSRLLLELAPLGDVEHGPEDLAAAPPSSRRDHALIEEDAVISSAQRQRYSQA